MSNRTVRFTERTRSGDYCLPLRRGRSDQRVDRTYPGAAGHRSRTGQCMRQDITKNIVVIFTKGPPAVLKDTLSAPAAEPILEYAAYKVDGVMSKSE